MTAARTGVLVALLVAGAQAALLGSDPPSTGHRAPAPAGVPAGTAKADETSTPPSAKPAVAPASANAATVREVMGRVRKLIADYERDAVPGAKDPGHGVAASPAAAAGRSGNRRSRVELVWRATLVWPTLHVPAAPAERLRVEWRDQ